MPLVTQEHKSLNEMQALSTLGTADNMTVNPHSQSTPHPAKQLRFALEVCDSTQASLKGLLKPILAATAQGSPEPVGTAKAQWYSRTLVFPWDGLVGTGRDPGFLLGQGSARW